MRNLEKIKELEHEIGRYQKKVADQAKEIDKLKEAQKRDAAGFIELNRMVDSIMAEVAISKGAQVGEDAWELVIPLVSVRRNTRDYEVHSKAGDDNDTYVIRVTRKAAMPEKEGEPDAADRVTH